MAKGGGVYEKRPEIVNRYFTLPYDVAVKTAEGLERAKAGDWIIEGVASDRPGSGARDLSDALTSKAT